MKKIAICLSFLLSTTLVGCTSYGDTFTEDEFVYKHIGDGSVDIIGYEGTSSEITIPLSISHLGTTYKVRNVESLNENKYIKKVIMPQTDEMFYEFECFENCSNLKEIETHNQLYNGLSFKGTSLGDAIYSSDSTILYAVNQSLEEFKVSNKTKTIESHAFERCMVEKVHIPNGVEDMHEYCFVDCKYLATIDTICTYYEPRSYTKEELFAGTEFEGEDFIPAAYMRNIMENMHLDWDGEKYVEMIDNSNRLPITVKQVPYCLFYGCHSIEDFTFDQFERIGLVFSDCSRLKQITISNCKCASYLFEICPSMDFVLFNDEDLEEFNLEEGFKNCKIQSQYLPSGITKMNFNKIAELELSIDFHGNDSMVEEIAKAKREHEAQVAAKKRAAQQAASNNNSNSSSSSSSKLDNMTIKEFLEYDPYATSEADLYKKVNDELQKYEDCHDELVLAASMTGRTTENDFIAQRLFRLYQNYTLATQKYVQYMRGKNKNQEANEAEMAHQYVMKQYNLLINRYNSM